MQSSVFAKLLYLNDGAPSLSHLRIVNDALAPADCKAMEEELCVKRRRAAAASAATSEDGFSHAGIDRMWERPQAMEGFVMRSALSDADVATLGQCDARELPGRLSDPATNNSCSSPMLDAAPSPLLASAVLLLRHRVRLCRQLRITVLSISACASACSSLLLSRCVIAAAYSSLVLRHGWPASPLR